MSKKRFKLFELKNVQVLVTRGFNGKSDEYTITVSFYPNQDEEFNVSCEYSYGDDSTLRDEVFDEYDEQKAQELVENFNALNQ